MPQRFAIFLLWLGFSIQTLALQNRNESSKFFLKSLANAEEGTYYPLKISLEVDEIFFQNTESIETVKEPIDLSVWILSDLVLFKPSKEITRFVEKIQCEDFLIHQAAKSKEIDGDLSLYITFNNDFQNEIITAKKCENDGQLLIVLISIDFSTFLTLEKVSQVKLLSSTLANIIFEDNLTRNHLMREIEGLLENFSDPGCPIDNCMTCLNSTSCQSCYQNYFLNGNKTQCCSMGQCETCNSGGTCDSCIEGYFLSNGVCILCTGVNCATCTWTSCIKCLNGYYPYDGLNCIPCPEGCELCNAGPGSTPSPICTQCHDPNNSEIANGVCTCLKGNYTYNQNNVCACPQGFYIDSNQDCVECNIGCQNCISLSHCDLCYDNEVMVPNADGSCSCLHSQMAYNPVTHVCNCPPAEYLNSTTLACDKCQNLCANCLAYDACYMCINENLVQSGGNCICADRTKIWNNTSESCVPCPYGTGGDDNGVCVPCSSGCATCPSTYDCIQCFPGLHVSNQGTCVCNEAFTIFNSATNTCESCDPAQPACDTNCITGCKVCSDSQTCQTCYESEEMVGGVCICKDHEQIFNVKNQKCQDVGSAKGLALVWILVLYAAI